jgi:hypothetical protein
MDSLGIIVIAETPSLGSALLELFASDHLEAHMVDHLVAAERYASTRPAAAPALLVAAANGRGCVTVEQWPKSSLRNSALVVVGARDVDRSEQARLHIVPLPLDPRRLLALVRNLAGVPGPTRGGPTEPSS